MKIKWYTGQREKIGRDVQTALGKTAQAIVTDLHKGQTLPRDTGELQENTQPDFSQSAKGIVSVVTNRPYARRLYFHPEYQFKRDKNRFAGAMWFEPYKQGKGNEWVKRTFAKFLKQARGNG